MIINNIKNRDFYKLSKSESMKTSPIFTQFLDYHYANYIPGKITYAEDTDVGLSFTTGEKLINFLGYGDQLTIINFNEKHPDFISIMENKYSYICKSMDEYRTTAILTKENISLSNPIAIKKIIQLASKEALNRAINFKDIECNNCPGLTYQLHRLDFKDSLDFWEHFVSVYKSVERDLSCINWDSL